MAIRIVRLGLHREADEGLRLGTVRRPPRGVPKSQYAQLDFYVEYCRRCDLACPVGSHPAAAGSAIFSAG